MNVCRHTLLAGAIAMAMACGGAYAQSTSGGTAGDTGSAQGQAGQRQGNAQGMTGGTQGGTNGANDMRGTTEGCAKRATTASRNVAEANRPPGSPVQGGASKGSTDWSDQANCANRMGHSNGGQSGAAQNPRNGGG